MDKQDVSKVMLMEVVPLASSLEERVQMIVVGLEEMRLVIYVER